MNELINCKFCTYFYWDRKQQYGYCKERNFESIADVNSYWSAQNCNMFKMDTALDPAKMTVLIKCIDCEHLPEGQNTAHCDKRGVTIKNLKKSRTCNRYKQKKDPNYVRINWNTHGNLHGKNNCDDYVSSENIDPAYAVNEINHHTTKYKFTTLKDSPFGVTSFANINDSSAWVADEGPPISVEIEGDTLIKGDLTVEGEIKMNENIERKIEEKQEKINKIVKKRKEFIKDYCSKLNEIDYSVRTTYIFDYGDVKGEFIKYIVSHLNKKEAKSLKKTLKNLHIRIGHVEILFKGKNVVLLSGDEWFFVKKILAIVNKFAPLFANEKLKKKFASVTSKYDALLFDEDSTICEKCGIENPIEAIYCNNCGKKV